MVGFGRVWVVLESEVGLLVALLRCVEMCGARWLIHCVFDDGCCGRDYEVVGVVGGGVLELDCVEEVDEAVGCYALDGIMLLVVAEVETRYLVRFE